MAQKAFLWKVLGVKNRPKIGSKLIFFQKLKKYELIEHKRNQKKQKMEEFKKSKHFEALLRGQKKSKKWIIFGAPLGVQKIKISKFGLSYPVWILKQFNFSYWVRLSDLWPWL